MVATLFVIGACSEDPGTGPANGDNDEQNDGPDTELELTISSGPDELTNETSAEFELSCNRDDGCDFSCRLNDGDMDDCDSTVTYSDLEPGSHIFTAVADDAYGDTSDPENWTWTVDTEPPAIEDLTGPPEVTGQREATFEFSCSKDDCSYECSLDDDSYESCQPGISYDGLDDGPYLFSVRAIDAAGNTGEPKNYQWTVDTESPLVVDLVGPDDPTNETSAAFEFGCSEDDCTFFCELSGADQGTISSESACEPGVDFTDLDDDDYTFSAFAVSTSGVEGPALTWEWTVDTETPQIAITEAPPAKTFQTWAALDFECTNKSDCSFQCALDHETPSGTTDVGDWESCTSTHVVDDLAIGDYDFHIEATDGAGNQETATTSWQVVEPGWDVTSAGQRHSCSIAADGTLWCWGRGDDGRLGLDDDAWQLTPEQVGTSSNWDDVFAGSAHTCAIRQSGTLWCWGIGDNGQLGMGDTDDQHTPQQVGGDNDWLTVGPGSNHTCALRDDDTLWCWGHGGSGRLGNGATSQVTSPEQIGSATDWTSVAGGVAHTHATRTTDAGWSWGRNTNGRLGDGTSWKTQPQLIPTP